jgi:hypothetical protein
MKDKHQLRLEIKAIAEDGSFEGRLSPYGNVDDGGDVVEPGAYTKTIQERGPKVPLLWQHKTDEPIGDLTLDDRPDGLYCKGQLLMSLATAQKAYLLIKAGILLLKEAYVNSVRHLKEVKLYEGSIVTFPMNEQALITSVKSVVDSWPAESCKTFLAALLELKSDEPKKTVDGSELTADCFAYVGDPQKTDTWKLPILFPGDDDKTKAHIRNALARFGQTEGIPDEERPKVLARIQAAAKRHGIDAGDGKSGRRVSAATKYTLAAAHEHMSNGAECMKSAMNLLNPLLGDEAEEEDDEITKALPITSKAAAGTEQPEPDSIHSAAKILDEMRSLIQAA